MKEFSYVNVPIHDYESAVVLLNHLQKVGFALKVDKDILYKYVGSTYKPYLVIFSDGDIFLEYDVLEWEPTMEYDLAIKIESVPRVFYGYEVTKYRAVAYGK